MQNKYFRYIWLVGVSATLGMFIINLAMGNQLTNYSAQTWMVFLATAVVSQMIGQPVLTAMPAIPLLGEIPSSTQWIGGAIALAGVYIVKQSHLQTQAETPNA